ncbi:MAG: hypothetical protein HXY50_05545 [Ignavibacteriaceae bacterium]|nr:hypothetical protein [Ignavibacteriaceae bacterium]
MIRSVLIVLSLLAILSSLIQLTSHKPITIKLIESPDQLAILFLTISLSLLFLFVFLITPETFSRLSKEDNLIEWCSMGLVLGGSIVFSISLFQLKKKHKTLNFVKIILILFALLFFLTAMEEISWFQRVLDFKTPNSFSRNYQNEFNIHNFVTNYAENAYYFSTFIYFGIIPFIWRVINSEIQSFAVKMLLPKPYLILICAIISAFNYDMWNIIFTQISFFGSVIILLLLIKYCTNNKEKILSLLVIVIVVCTQYTFLINGSNFKRYWEVTEYKEFFIAIILFAYSISVFKNIKLTASSDIQAQYNR